MNFLPTTDKGRSPLECYAATRRLTDWIVEPLEPEDCVIQSMPDVSPTRWHLAHTTWFFETFLLAPSTANYQPVAPEFEYLFNSYYNTVGEQFPRHQRGLLSRPSLADVGRYRQEVDQRVKSLLSDGTVSDEQLRILELGIHHEQQHQELMLTDIKHVFSCNPLGPIYRTSPKSPQGKAAEDHWIEFSGGVVDIGHHEQSFCFDNELPQFETLLPPCKLQSRLVTSGEYAEFIEAGGYNDPSHWLSLGWATVQRHRWESPLYWRRGHDGWEHFTLNGWQAVDMSAPVTHVSYFEADAYARWRGKRLPTEFEWETLCPELQGGALADANFVESGLLRPCSASHGQWLGDCWEWTSSSYSAYPGYRPPAGALGEYNGKFMCNQYVLRGGSCATSRRHIRPTYRNFFPPETRWQFSGIRLAHDAR